MDIDRDAVRQVLLELLDQNTEMRRGKTFVIPKNVQGKYTIFLGLSLREVLKWVLPPLGFAAVLFAVPPYYVPFLLCKLLILGLILATAIIIPAGRPISSRPNINYADYWKLIWQYHKRQKLFFIGRRASALEKALGHHTRTTSPAYDSRRLKNIGSL